MQSVAELRAILAFIAGFLLLNVAGVAFFMGWGPNWVRGVFGLDAPAIGTDPTTIVLARFVWGDAVMVPVAGALSTRKVIERMPRVAWASLWVGAVFAAAASLDLLFHGGVAGIFLPLVLFMYWAAARELRSTTVASMRAANGPRGPSVETAGADEPKRRG